jgi:probable HAF family extracellular repeat protein
MVRPWVLLPIIPMAFACREPALTAPPVSSTPTTVITDLPVPIPLPVRIDLGTFGGASSYANDLNGNNIVVGSAQNAAGLSHAFRWTALGGMTDLGTLPGDDWSSACCITDHGQILGISGLSSVSTSQGTPVLWSSSGTISALAIPLLEGAQFGMASDFNTRGDVVGSDVIAAQHAWIWSDAQGKYDITANVPGGSFEGAASGIDGAGFVVGTNNTRGACDRFISSCWRPFLWSYEEGYRELGTPEVDPTARATALGVADGPTVVGWASATTLGQRPYRWTEDEGFIVLPTVAGGYALSVNGSGTAVGAAWDPVVRAYQATAWPRSGGAIRLSPDNPQPQVAVAVNDARVVVGWSAQSGGGNHATVWLLGPVSDVLAHRAALKPRAPGATLTRTAVAAAAVANACLSDTEALVSRGALFDCVNRSAAGQ